METSIYPILLVIFFASTIRSAFGFGESLIAVPLLTFFIPIEIAVPLSVLLSTTIAFISMLTDFREVHFKSAKNLVFSTLFGIPLGLILLKYGNESQIKVTLGVLIISFSLFLLFYKSEIILNDKKSTTYFFGFLAGILGGAYGMNGPPLVVYGNLRKWKPQNFRATLHAYFFPASIIGMIGYYQLGLWTSKVTTYYLFSLIAIVPAIFMGKLINQNLPITLFKNLVYWMLVIIGCSLILESTVLN
ncbi:sulfite exporter TauE/SafE family protein [Halobacteriovorax sp. JY17]|uniref:sulfite exporter TauE/SafE family protein n=1 Tax=Halobacteriovorax sp. JY17 TaxID=2014617 RepID=UPI000C6A70CA|nr:sulfite exporter TauE/SafE family protein [Halobacteriovorax sp. JY17]PIK15127.1 MAG: permease [Halobacteriovorax sp. JY17]